MKHTPTPWKIDDEYGRVIVDSKNKVVILAAPVGYENSYLSGEEEDFNFLIHAVNSHDELLEACKALIKQLRIQARLAHGAGGGIAVHEDNYKVWQQAEKAIQKAEGK